MVIMALDHVRDYVHYGSFFIDPSACVRVSRMQGMVRVRHERSLKELN